MNASINTVAKPLSEIFQEPWDIFTVDELDEKTVAKVLNNVSPPQNAAHFPTFSGIQKSAYEFCEDNNAELLKAIHLLEG